MDESNTSVLSDSHGPPAQLQDALARISEAKSDYNELVIELDKFVVNYVKGMLKGFAKGSNDFQMEARPPEESIVRGRPTVLLSQIVEHLRTALDYLVFELSVLNAPSDWNESVPQFVIALDRKQYERAARNRLRYLTSDQKAFIEYLQPFNENGNEILGLINIIAVRGKHRQLLTMANRGGFVVIFADIQKKGEYPGHYCIPVGRGEAVFLKTNSPYGFRIFGKWEAMEALWHMIDRVERIIEGSYCFFEGRPWKTLS